MLLSDYDQTNNEIWFMNHWTTVPEFRSKISWMARPPSICLRWESDHVTLKSWRKVAGRPTTVKGKARAYMTAKKAACFELKCTIVAMVTNELYYILRACVRDVGEKSRGPLYTKMEREGGKGSERDCCIDQMESSITALAFKQLMVSRQWTRL